MEEKESGGEGMEGEEVEEELKQQKRRSITDECIPFPFPYGFIQRIVEPTHYVALLGPTLPRPVV